MKAMLILLIVASTIYASEMQTCMEKLDEIKMLKEQRLSWYDKAGLYLVSGLWAADRPKNVDEQIRVLELELKECKQNSY